MRRTEVAANPIETWDLLARICKGLATHTSNGLPSNIGPEGAIKDLREATARINYLIDRLQSLTDG